MSLTWGQYFTANTIGIATSILPFGTSIPTIGVTAAFAQDEFYEQTRFVHQVMAFPIASVEMMTACVVGTCTFGPIVPIIAAVGVISNLFINHLIIPNIADQIHEYTHPHINHSVNLDSFYKINPSLDYNINTIGIDNDLSIKII